MSNSAPLSPVKQALLEIRRLRQKLANAEAAQREPIAIVGVGLRFPGGARDPDRFHEQLCAGLDAITDVPHDRWDMERFFNEDRDVPGTMYARHGGFLADVAGFDPEFFGISPFEAGTIDPQQRLLLEVTWEALENAGIAASDLRGSRTGVFVGIASGDYGRLALNDPAEIDEYASQGTAFSVAGGRLSYVLGLHGPAISVDTACSSSLVAVHLACQSLRLGESELAVAAGVNLILTPEVTINFCRAGMLAVDGRCKTFDASADGYVRSEGCGVVLLKRLSDAQRDGDRILGVIRGSAINQDGRSSGLTAPNGPAQESVIRAALANAGLQPADIAYVEAHGTGTSLGDPIEVTALGAVFSADRPADRPLLLGSVKTNLGHLEAAAGIAGLIKTVQALRRGEIPPHRNFSTPNPHVAWDALRVAVPTVLTPFKRASGRRLAGVSSFGFSGTNAHVILEEPPERPASNGSGGTADASRGVHVLTISAQQEPALHELVSQYAAVLRAASAEQFADVCHTASAGRSHFAHRVAVVAEAAGSALAGLEAWQAGTQRDNVHAAIAPPRRPPLAFVFTGDARCDHIARELLRTSVTAAAHLNACDAVLADRLPVPLLRVLDPANEALLEDPEYAEPLRCAVFCTMAELWRAWGFEPAVVIGTGSGEIAAACVAGVFDFKTALHLAMLRGRMLTYAGNTAAQAAIAREVNAALQTAASTATVKARFISARTGAVVSSVELLDAVYWQRATSARRVKAALRSARAEQVKWFIELGARAITASGLTVEEDSLYVAAPRSNENPWAALLDGLARLYVAGADVRWKELARGEGRTRVSLPTYAFHRRAFWLQHARRAGEESNSGAGTQAADARRGADAAVETAGAVERATAAAAEAALTGALRRSELAPLELNIGSYAAKWAALEEFTRETGRNMVAAAGVFAEAGVTADADHVLAAIGAPSMYRPIVVRWLDALAADGSLERIPGGYRASNGIAPVDTAPLLARIDHLLADNQPLLDYIRNCAALLPDVMRGRASPLETLFPGGSFDLATRLYERSTVMRYVNGIAAAALETYVANRPVEAPVRVLEFGAGTGGTTSSLLPVLPNHARYDFTDVSEIFLENAAQRFAEQTSVQTRLFDIEKDPAAQGFEPVSYDVIIGSNVLHAARNIRAALARIQSLLAPGGLVLLIESTGHLAWHDISTGLIEGWQHFEDDLRQDTPLLPAGRWVELLKEAGFLHAGAAPVAGSPAEILKQHVLVAGAPLQAVAAHGVGVPAVAAAVPARNSITSTAAQSNGEFARALVALTGSAREDAAATAIRECVMEILRSDPARPPARDARLMELGVDSLMAVRLRNLIQKRLGLETKLPATLIFDYPTITHIARLVVERVVGTPAHSETTSVTEVTASAAREAEIAALSDAEAEALLLSRLELEI